MAENSSISWTDHTFNPWVGCTKVSPACDGCYAENLMAHRYGRVKWGAPGRGEGTRARTSAANWKAPLTWNRKAEREATRPFVFCASLADVFDNAVPADWRRDLFDLIRATPNLTWLLLTKRPGNIARLFSETITPELRKAWATPDRLGKSFWPSNAAIGCTVVTQEEADRDIPKLLVAKAGLRAAFAFVSMEPLLGHVELGRHHGLHRGDDYIPRLDWVIAGGETDQGVHDARPCNPAWFRSLRDQCTGVGVPFHFKQHGEWVPGALRELSPVVMSCEERAIGPNGEVVRRVGKRRDPCTLDGVRHLARPESA
jgi:protein gp37